MFATAYVKDNILNSTTFVNPILMYLGTSIYDTFTRMPTLKLGSS